MGKCQISPSDVDVLQFFVSNRVPDVVAALILKHCYYLLCFPDGVAQIVVDDTRNILYTRSEKGTITVKPLCAGD